MSRSGNCETPSVKWTGPRSRRSSRSAPISRWLGWRQPRRSGSTSRYWRSIRRPIGGRCAATASPTRSTASARCCSIIDLATEPLWMAEWRLRVDPEERPRRPPQRVPRRRGIGSVILRQAIKTFVLLLLWTAIIGGGVLSYFALTLPDTSELTHAERRPSVTILAADGSLLATFGDLFGQPLSLREMSPNLPKAVVATEDRRFYSHFGVDPIGLLRAASANLTAGHVVQGGSTITQQLAKNLFLTPERSLPRKIRETLLALWLEHRFTKDEILEIYLNRVYLGAGTYGVDAAAHRYFGKSARQTNLYESAAIAGLLKAPTKFNPTRDRDKAAARTAQVLANMVEVGMITESQVATATKEGVSRPVIAAAGSGARYFADWVAEQLADFAVAGTRDLTVTTTLDPVVQAEAEVQVAQRAGIRKVIAVAHQLGISSDLAPEMSLALGTGEVNLLELVSAYAPFANGGLGVWPHGIAEVRDSEGNAVFRRTGSGVGRVVTPELAGTMNEMLSAVIGHGTGRSAALPRPAAGKTGTTQDYRDAWFVGYTADLIAGVWLGNDDYSPTNKVTGGSLPAQTWRQFMLAATRFMPMRPLPAAPSASG